MKFVTRLFSLLILVFAFYSPSSIGSSMPTIAVVDFDSAQHRHRGLGEVLSNLMSEKLLESELFDVVEREKLNSAVKEMGLSGSGLVDPGTAVEVGKMVGAQYLMTGKILNVAKDTKRFNNYGTSITTSTVTVTASVEIIEAATSRKVFSKRASASAKNQAMGGLQVQQLGVGANLLGKVADKFAVAINDSKRLQKITRANAPPAQVKITITSNPPGADLEVDGVYFGNVGGEIELTEGLHSVVVSLPGYERWEKKVMIKQGAKFNASLTKVTGEKITVDVNEKIEIKNIQ